MTRPALQCLVVRDGDVFEPGPFEAWFELAARRVGRGVGLLSLDRPADLADPRLEFVLRTVNGCLGDLERQWVEHLDAAAPAQGQSPPADLETRLKKLDELKDPLIHHLLALSAACAENNRTWGFGKTWDTLVAPTLDRFHLAYTAMPEPRRGATFGVGAALATLREEFSKQLTPAGDAPGEAGDKQSSARAPAAGGGGPGAAREPERMQARRPPPTTREVIVAALGVLAAAAALVVTFAVGWEVAIVQGVVSTLLVEAVRPAARIARGVEGPDAGIGIA